MEIFDARQIKIMGDRIITDSIIKEKQDLTYLKWSYIMSPSGILKLL